MSCGFSADPELWIDLQCLIDCAMIINDKLVICYQYNKENPEPLHSHEKYLLRVALRAVGYKITRVKSIFDENVQCIQKEYYTDIPKDVSERMTMVYNKWTEDIHEEAYT